MPPLNYVMGQPSSEQQETKSDLWGNVSRGIMSGDILSASRHYTILAEISSTLLLSNNAENTVQSQRPYQDRFSFGF